MKIAILLCHGTAASKDVRISPAPSLLAFAVLVATATLNVNAQECLPDQGCAFNASAGNSIAMVNSAPVFIPVPTLTSGGVKGYFLLNAGETYEWSTREEDGGLASFDSELTLYTPNGVTQLCYGNDAGSSGAFISWTASTSGGVFLALNASPCQADTSQTILMWRCASCPALPSLSFPTTGSVQLECGSDMRLLDPGGIGYHPNNTNSYAVLNASGSAQVRVRGTFSAGDVLDSLKIYAGIGITGPVQASYSQIGFLDYTGSPGQPITLRFLANASGFSAGFDLMATYTGVCEPVGINENETSPMILFPNPTSGSMKLVVPMDRSIASVELLDLRGVSIRTWKPRTNVREQVLELDGGLAPGYYILRVRTGTTIHEERIMVL